MRGDLLSVEFYRCLAFVMEHQPSCASSPSGPGFEVTVSRTRIIKIQITDKRKKKKAPTPALLPCVHACFTP